MQRGITPLMLMEGAKLAPDAIPAKAEERR